ncbi:two pore domain potassium channel family protein [Candidatus Woesearchaeota archaeon]|nr:two pore domain potassium channel family protein [Candidatus Woesearchaeota archaeon]
MDLNAKEEKKKIIQKIFSLLSIVVSLLIIGTIVYSRLEGWGFVDSLYFSTTTLTTIGYGDITPSTEIGKLFTVLFALTGVAIMLYSLTILGTHYIHYLDTHKPAFEHRMKKAIKTINPLSKKEDGWFVLKDKKKE